MFDLAGVGVEDSVLLALSCSSIYYVVQAGLELTILLLLPLKCWVLSCATIPKSLKKCSWGGEGCFIWGICLYICMSCVFRCSKRPEEGIRSTEPRISGGWEAPDMRLRSSGRAVSALNSRATSPGLGKCSVLA